MTLALRARRPRATGRGPAAITVAAALTCAGLTGSTSLVLAPVAQADPVVMSAGSVTFDSASTGSFTIPDVTPGGAINGIAVTAIGGGGGDGGNNDGGSGARVIAYLDAEAGDTFAYVVGGGGASSLLGGGGGGGSTTVNAGTPAQVIAGGGGGAGNLADGGSAGNADGSGQAGAGDDGGYGGAGGIGGAGQGGFDNLDAGDDGGNGNGGDGASSDSTPGGAGGSGSGVGGEPLTGSGGGGGGGYGGGAGGGGVAAGDGGGGGGSVAPSSPGLPPATYDVAPAGDATAGSPASDGAVTFAWVVAPTPSLLNIGTDTVQVTWTVPAQPNSVGTVTYAVVVNGVAGDPSTSPAVLSGLPDQVPVTIQVLATSDTGLSTLSPPVSITPGPAPVIGAVTPGSGVPAGGTQVTLTGSGFEPGATVTFGTTPAAAVTYVSATQVTATTPAGLEGAVDVSLANPDGLAVTLPQAFTYTALPPAPSSITPTLFNEIGGTPFTITGINFAAGATVTIGGSAATGIQVTPTTISGVAPAGTGRGTVLVRNPNGASGTLPSTVRFIPVPAPTAITPAAATTTGSVLATITGTGLIDESTVTVGGTPATVTGTVAGGITVVIPPGAAGAADVVITNPHGVSATLAAAFTYVTATQTFGVGSGSISIPGGAEVVQVQAIGGSGGAGFLGNLSGDNTYPGGAGAVVTSSVPVGTGGPLAGSAVAYTVGGQGTASTAQFSGGGGGGGSTNFGAGNTWQVIAGGGGGGGTSDGQLGGVAAEGGLPAGGAGSGNNAGGGGADGIGAASSYQPSAGGDGNGGPGGAGQNSDISVAYAGGFGVGTGAGGTARSQGGGGGGGGGYGGGAGGVPGLGQAGPGGAGGSIAPTTPGLAGPTYQPNPAAGPVDGSLTVIALNAPVLTVTPGVGQVVVAWTAPAQPLGDVEYVVYQDGVPTAYSAAGSGSATVTDLSNGQVYDFTVVASVTSVGRVIAQTTSVPSAAQPGIAPAISSATIQGTPAVGQTLSADVTVSSGVPTPEVTYQWQVRATPTARWTDLAEATASTLLMTPDLYTSYLRVTATATNPLGDAVSRTASVGPVDGQAAALTAVALNGTAAVGASLTAQLSGLVGTPTPTVTYQWQVSADTTGPWTAIPGAIGPVFGIGAAYYGDAVRVTVTAANTLGTQQQTSPASAMLAGQAPEISSTTVTGTPIAGATLTASATVTIGTPTPTVTYLWQSAPAADGPWEPIAGATDPTYDVRVTDNGLFLRAISTATNGVGTPASGSSPAVGPVGGAAPQIGGVSVDGTAVQGALLTAEVTAVTGSPAPELDYRWQQALPSGAGTPGAWRDIPGATGSTFALTADQVGFVVRASVNARNGISPRAHADSVATGTVAPPSPVPADVVSVSISGFAIVGATVTADATVTGVPAPAVTYQWQRKPTSATTWTPIGTATSADTLTVPRAAYREQLRVVATATNGVGQPAQATSTPVGPVTAAAPTVTAVSPTKGPFAGGTQIVITGTDFFAGATVTMGGRQCAVRSVTTSTITCTTPRAHRAGPVGLRVTNTDAQSAVLEAAYTYGSEPAWIRPFALPRQRLAVGVRVVLVNGLETNAELRAVAVACIKGGRVLPAARDAQVCRTDIERAITDDNSAGADATNVRRLALKIRAVPQCTRDVEIRVRLSVRGTDGSSRLWERTWPVAALPNTACPRP